MYVTIWRLLARLWLVIGLCLAGVGTAHAANCNYATAQGATGPINWQTYCWIDFSSYNDAQARSAGGQAYALTLQDGSVMTFTMTVSGTPIGAVATPTWGGAAVGNTAFLGIAGQPSLYQSVGGTTTVTFSNIIITPPAGAAAVSNYMFVAADAESSNDAESLTFQSNGGGWVLLDEVGPISGSNYPGSSGIGTPTYTVTGASGTVGAAIVGSILPTTVVATIVGGGLQGAMFAVRFASIRLNTVISGARAAPADQFTFSINAASNGAVLAAGSSSGAGLGPFTAASLSITSAVPVTVNQAMASGSTSSLARYRSSLSCSNGNAGSPTALPNGAIVTSYAFPTLQFGDAVQCTFTETPFPQLTLQKALGATGRQFPSDQFALSIRQGGTTVASTTTAGTGATLTNATTPQVQAVSGTTYQLAETGVGATSLAQYTASMACANANTASATPLPTAPGGTITPAMGDVVSCTITNTAVAANALLTIVKDAVVLSDPVNGAVNPKYIPGAIVRYAFTVSNSGPAAADNNSVWLIDTLPTELAVGTAANPVFIQGTPGSGLSFSAASDIRYSNAVSPPASFAACTYSPAAAYDPAVRYICLNPKGVMAGSSGTPPSFTVSVEAQVR